MTGSLIRPELVAAVRPWRETIWAAATGLVGVWLISRGGWLFWPLGLLILGVAVVWGIDAARRTRFARDISAPGLVEIEEGAIRYYGAHQLGGEIALRDLTEIRLLRLSGRDHWRLRTDGGEALLIPLNAAGAGTLASAFTALPGFHMAETVAAIDSTDSVRTVWRRP